MFVLLGKRASLRKSATGWLFASSRTLEGAKSVKQPHLRGVQDAINASPTAVAVLSHPVNKEELVQHSTPADDDCNFSFAFLPWVNDVATDITVICSSSWLDVSTYQKEKEGQEA